MRPDVSRDAVNFGFHKTRESLEQVEDKRRLSALLHGVTSQLVPKPAQPVEALKVSVFNPLLGKPEKESRNNFEKFQASFHGVIRYITNTFCEMVIKQSRL
jgi:hypothetical protein